MSLRRTVAVAACVLCLVPAPASAALRAGAASADLTPPIGTPMFAYTARSGIANPDNLPTVALNLLADPGSGHYAKTFVPSQGIHVRVRSRALVLEQGGRTFAFVQADLGGLPFSLYQDVADAVADLGITRDTLLLSATHTHSSVGNIWPTENNAGYAALGGDVFDPRVFAVVRDGIVKAIRDAHARLEPAKAGLATVQVTDASRNRNFDPFRADPEAPKDEAAARQASIDPDMTVLRVDALDGAPIGVWSNFAVHPTTFGDDNLLFSGDNAGIGARLAESGIAEAAARAGAPAPRHPVVDVWTNANEGDISPNGDPDVLGGEKVDQVANAFQSVTLAGRRQAEGIVRAWRNAGAALDPAIAIDARRTMFSFDGTQADGQLVGPEQVLGNGGVVAPDGTCAPVNDFAGPGQGPKMPLAEGFDLVPGTASVSVVGIGGYAILGLPSEVTRTMGARIRGKVVQAGGGAFGRAIIAGLTNGYLSYTATPEEYDTCHYEGSFTLFGRQQGARYRDVAVSLARALVSHQPVSAGAAEPPSLELGVGGFGPRATPDAGRIVGQPAASLDRFGRASFSWTAGDPAVDAPRDRALVTLEREAPGGWDAVATDDSFADTTRLTDGVWHETWQFSTCDPVGRYRLHVTGMADRGDGAKPYELTSNAFSIGALKTLKAGTVTVAKRRARVIVTYPDAGKDALVVLPRLLRTGIVTLRYRSRSGRSKTLRAKPERGAPGFVAKLPKGARRVKVTGVRDRCGNRGR